MFRFTYIATMATSDIEIMYAISIIITSFHRKVGERNRPAYAVFNFTLILPGLLR